MKFEMICEPRACAGEVDLIGHCRLGGVDFHITCVAVKTGEPDGDQQATDSFGRYEALQDFEDTAEAFQTMTIDGKPYVVVLTPFCE